MSERREYDVRPADNGRPALRSVKLPGEQRHIGRSESAKAIARRLAISQREKALAERASG